MWLAIQVSESTLGKLLNGQWTLELHKCAEYDNLKVGDIVELYSPDNKLNEFVVIKFVVDQNQQLEIEFGLLPNLPMIDMFEAVDNIDYSACDMELGLKLNKHKPKWLHDIFKKHEAKLCDSGKLPKYEDSEIYTKLIKHQDNRAKLKKYELLLSINDEAFEPIYFPDVKNTAHELKAADYIAKIFENKSSFQISEDGDRCVIRKQELDNIAGILKIYQKYCAKLDKNDQSLDDIISGLEAELEPIKDNCDREYEKWSKAVVESAEYVRNFKQNLDQQDMSDYQGFDNNGVYRLMLCIFNDDNDGYKTVDSTTTTMVAKTGKDFVQNLQICMGPNYDDEYYISRVWYDLKFDCYMVDIGRN